MTKDQRREYEVKYRRSKKGLAVRSWHKQRENSKRRGHPEPTYTSKELYDWLLKHPDCERLFLNWEKSGFIRGMKPSFDRIDFRKPYTLDNLQLITWKENNHKGHQLERPQVTKRVDLLDRSGNLISTFDSPKHIARYLKTTRKLIYNALNEPDRVKTVKGYKVRYNPEEDLYPSIHSNE